MKKRESYTRVGVWFLALTLAVLLAATGSALAATITVTNNNDSGAGSLRQAIADASSGDTIDLTGRSGDITLTSGPLILSKNLTITGPGADILSITSNFMTDYRVGSTPLFQINSGKTATLEGVTLCGNTSTTAGGIYNEGNLTVNDSRITGNLGNGGAGGISNFGDLTIRNSTIDGNTSDYFGAGGGIANNGTCTIVNSTISGNESLQYDGGGISNTDQLDILGTTIVDNSSYGSGGGIWNGGGNFTCTGAAFYGNTHGSGYYGDNVWNSSGVPHSGGWNFVPGGSSSIFNSTDDNVSNTDALLGGLEDNGGMVPTHMPQTGSPLIDAGPDTYPGLTVDQVGNARPQDGDNDGTAYFDIGSIEVPAVAGNQAPIADAGPNQSVGDLQSVTLDGTGSSDPDGDTLDYYWTQSDENGYQITDPDEMVILQDGDPGLAYFTAPPQDSGSKNYYFILDVNDPSGATDSDMTRVTVTPLNFWPTVAAGDLQTVLPGSSVVLDGSSYDYNDDPAGVQWYQTDCSGGTLDPADAVNINNAFTYTASFTAPADTGALCFNMVVTDTGGLASFDTTIVNVAPPANTPPTVSISGDNEVPEDDEITLTASPQGATYQWYEAKGDGWAPISGATSDQLCVDSPGTYKCVVTDSAGLIGTGTKVVEAPSATEITILLMLGFCLVVGLRSFRRRRAAA